MASRALIVFLLVLNLGVALWWVLRPAAVPEGPPAHPAGVPRLQLLSEATPEVRQAASTARADAGPDLPPAPEPETTTTEVADARSCFAFGPYADAAALAGARTWLQPRVAQLRVREVARGTRGWRVMLAPQADRAAAQAVVDRLVAAGFDDHFIIGQGEEANAIALGRFGSEEAARRHQAALREAGFQARAEPLGGGEVRTWVDVAVAAGFDPAAARTATGAERADALDCTTLR